MKLTALFAAIMVSFSSQGAWDIWQAYMIVNVNGGGNSYWQAGLDGGDPTPSFVNNNYGRFTSGQSLVMDGVELKTYKNGSSDVCTANGYYRVYRTCDTPGSFTSIGGPFICNHPCTGLNNPGDQKWGTTGFNANVLSGLTASGTYVIEVYWDITGGDTGGCAQTKFANNGGVNYRAYFEFEVTDHFTDGNISATPAWSGDTGSWTVVSNSDVAGLLGSEATRSQTVRLNASSAGTQHISTTITNWNSQQEWYFFVGRRGQSATSANQTIVWLYANEANLESATVDGYRIVIGDDSGGDEIRLQRVDDGAPTTIFETVQSVTNNIIDWGITFKITRRSIGRWTIQTSTLPTASGNGATAWSCPEALSTVTHTNALELGNPDNVIDNTHIPPVSGTGHFGIMAVHGSGSGEMTGMEFDNLRVRFLPPDTYVQISGSVSSTVMENASGLTSVGVDIFNASGTNATTVQLVRISGAASRFGGGLVNSGSYAPSYSTQTLTWNAGETGTKFFYLDPDDNNLCDDVATIVLQLQSATGGLNAYVGPTDTYTWTIDDDNFGYQTLIDDNFNDGNLTSPTPAWSASPAGSFTASTSTPINGTHSLRSTLTGASGQTRVTLDLDKASLPGLTSTWRFQLQYNLEPNPANKFMVFLAATESDLWSGTVDGYAVGIDPILSGDPDILTLWRIENGAPAAAIVTSTLDWGIAQNIVGFEIVRSEAGLWTLRIDSDGGFDNLVSQGTPATDLVYTDAGFFGPRFLHTASNGGRLALDDVSFDQKGCRTVYYSRATGNWDDAIWSLQPTGGTPPWTAINSSRYTRLVIQPTHTVTLNTTGVCNDLTIDATGTLNASGNTLSVFGNWLNNGTFTASTSTVVMKGDATQGFNGATTTRFNNLHIDNDAGTVNCNVDVEVRGQLLALEGTLQANDNLIIVSDATQSGSIGPISSGADVAGTLTLQRHVPLATAGWVFLGCPMPGRTIADWDDDIIVTGITGGNDGFNPPGYTFINIYSYNEAVAGDRNNGWTAATNVTNSLLTQRGYNVYMQAGAQDIDLTGTIQKGPVTIPVTFTNSSNAADGWNLVTNPYPSEVDWVAVEANSSDVASYYVYDSALPGYRAYNANTLTGSASRYIAHSQSFFVKANIVGQNLNFEETHKTNTNAAFERVLDAAVSEAYFRLERDGLADEGSLTFIEGATDNYEQMFDAEYFENSNTQAPEFAFVSADNVLMEIDARPNFTNSLQVPVYLDLPSAGTYIFSVLSTQNIPLGSCIAVEDVVSGTMMSMEQGSSMSITVDAPYQGNRLIIHVSTPITVTTTDATCFNAANGTVTFEASQGSWSYSVANDMNTVVYASQGNTSWDQAVAGHYLITLSNSDAACEAITYDVFINEPDPSAAWAEGSPDLCNAGGGGLIVFGGGSGASYAYTLTNEEGLTVLQGETSDFALELIGLDADVYSLTITDGCGAQSFTLDLNDPNALTAEIYASATNVVFDEGFSTDVILSAPMIDNTNYAWTYNGELVGQESTLVYSINTESAYTFVLEMTNNTCFATGSITITGEMQEVGVAENAVQQAVTWVPLNGGIQLTFHTASAAVADITVYNSTGQLVQRTQGTEQGQVVFLALDGLAQGVYTFRVTNPEGVLLTGKVVR